MRELFIEALQSRYVSEIKVAKATIQVYLEKSVGIGEHPQFVNEMDRQIEIIANAE